MSTNYPNRNPLNYVGTNVTNPPQLYPKFGRPPLPTDYLNFNLGDEVLDSSVTPPVWWKLVSKADGIATWEQLTGFVGGVSSVTGTGNVNVTPTTGNPIVSLTGTIPVANGGTGDPSFSVNQLIAGGSTSTGALQQVAAGSVGQVLVSEGSAIPSFTPSLTVSPGGVTTVSGSYSLPTTAGTANYVLTTNGSNAASWQPASGSGGISSVIGTAPIGVATVGGVADVSLSGVVPVANGGTGDSSFSVNQLIAGGSTSTGALQQVAAGSVGQVLVSGGSGVPSFTPALTVSPGGITTVAGAYTLPTTVGTLNYVLASNGAGASNWQSVSSVGGFVAVNMRTFASSGTYTPTTGMSYCIVEIVGGGGAGGSTAGAVSSVTAGGGGGAGEYARGLFSAASIGASQTITIGAGGANGGAIVPGTGGGTTSFGSLMTAVGGAVGSQNIGTNSTTAIGGLGGTGGTGGNLRNPGQSGGVSSGDYYSGIGTAGFTGPGGSSIYGAGGASFDVNTSAGNGLGYGSGGGGIVGMKSGSVFLGGNGAPGIVIVTEYIG